eukprot:gene25257-10905_t
MSSSVNLTRTNANDRAKQEAITSMDLVAIMRAYISTMIEEAQGYKALIVDAETMRIASLLFGRTELAEHNVVHIEKIEQDGKSHQELKVGRDNITMLKRELKSPRYQSYYVFFTNLLSSVHLQELAEADAPKERVMEVKEFYGDFIAVDNIHFTIPVGVKNDLFITPKPAGSSLSTAQEIEVNDRFVQGLSALFLALRRRPVIRYQRGSDACQRLADSLYMLTYKQQYQVFDFGSRSTPIMLILDRKDDPVTPLLTQWTYQAMLHELVGVTDNTIKLTSTKWTYQAVLHELVGVTDNTIKLTSTKIGTKPLEIALDSRQDKFYRNRLQSICCILIGIEPLKMVLVSRQDEFYRNRLQCIFIGIEPLEMVLDSRQDEFYRNHLHSNYGDVGNDVRQLVEKFQSTSEKHKNVESLEDMRRFVMEHMDFQRLQGNVTKHVNIMTELSERINARNLMEVSMAEQELANPATSLTAAASYDEITRILRQPLVLAKDKVRLVMLYALRFESDTLRVRQLLDFLLTAGLRDSEPKLFAAVEAVLKYAGAAKRAGDLYGTRSIMNKARSMFKGLRDVENVYTQHTPLLTATLTMLSTDKLEASNYPYMASSQDEAMAYQTAFKRTPAREVIVFIVGGSTYEEAKSVAEWNERNPHMKVILGGSAVLNSDMFLNALSGNVAAGYSSAYDTDSLR